MSLYQNLETEKNKGEEKEVKSLKNKKTIDKFDVDEKPIKQLDKIIIGKYSDAPDYLKDNECLTCSQLN